MQEILFWNRFLENLNKKIRIVNLSIKHPAESDPIKAVLSSSFSDVDQIMTAHRPVCEKGGRSAKVGSFHLEITSFTVIALLGSRFRGGSITYSCIYFQQTTRVSPLSCRAISGRRSASLWKNFWRRWSTARSTMFLLGSFPATITVS